MKLAQNPGVKNQLKVGERGGSVGTSKYVVYSFLVLACWKPAFKENCIGNLEMLKGLLLKKTALAVGMEKSRLLLGVML